MNYGFRIFNEEEYTKFFLRYASRDDLTSPLLIECIKHWESRALNDVLHNKIPDLRFCYNSDCFTPTAKYINLIMTPEYIKYLFNRLDKNGVVLIMVQDILKSIHRNCNTYSYHEIDSIKVIAGYYVMNHSNGKYEHCFISSNICNTVIKLINQYFKINNLDIVLFIDDFFRFGYSQGDYICFKQSSYYHGDNLSDILSIDKFGDFYENLPSEKSLYQDKHWFQRLFINKNKLICNYYNED